MSKSWKYALALFFITLAIYIPSLNNGFIWDDNVIIDHQIHTLRDARTFFFPVRTQESTPAYYRPAVGLSLVLDYSLHYKNPRGYHLTNILINLLNVLLVFLLSLNLFELMEVRHRHLLSFMAALLFALHPLHVESVSWIAGRTDLVVAFFSLLAFLSYVLFRKEKNISVLLAGFVFYFFALLSKENGIGLLLLFPLFDLLVLRKKLHKTLLPFVFFLLITASYFYLRYRAGCLVAPPGAGEEPTLFSKAITLIYAFGFYLRKLVYPLPLSMFIDKVPHELYIGLLPLLYLFILAISLMKRGRAAFLLLWILLTLGPSLLIAISRLASTPLAERYLYLPSAGFALLVPYGLYRIGRPIKKEVLLLYLLVPYLLWFAIETLDRQRVWKDDLSLWADAVKKAPRSALPHNEYGMALRERGLIEDAEREFLTALTSNSRESKSWKAYAATNLALIYMDRDEYDAAEKYLKEALEFYPNYPIALYDLGLLYLIRAKNEGENGEPNRALLIKAGKTLKRAVRADPNFIRAHLMLGEAYYLYGKPEKAKEHLEKVIELDPRSPEAQDAVKLLSKIETAGESRDEKVD